MDRAGVNMQNRYSTLRRGGSVARLPDSRHASTSVVDQPSEARLGLTDGDIGTTTLTATTHGETVTCVR